VLSCTLIMVLCAILIGFRLVPQHFEQGTAWGILWPMMVAGLVRSFEVAVLIGTPVGFALARVRSSPNALPKSAGSSVVLAKCLRFVPAFGWFVVAGALGAYTSLRWNAPAGVARDVIEASRRACVESHGKSGAAIPLIGAHWVCAPSAVPRLVGEISKQGRTTQYSASAIDLSRELDYVDLTDLKLVSLSSVSAPSVHLAVGEARLRGVLPWVNAARFRGWERAFYVAAAALCLALLDASTTLRRVPRRRFVQVLAALVGGVVAWYWLRVADAQLTLRVAGYLSVPVVGIVAQVVTWLGIDRVMALRR
jgi:hypothetical protein